MKSSEAGRSIVEMIAVLCIMGLLSIGSLWSYDAARERARATGIVDNIAKLLAVARVKGGEVDSEKMKMNVLRDYEVKIWAQIDGSLGKVVVCGCKEDGDDRKWAALESRIQETSGVSTGTAVEGHSLNACMDGLVSTCFSLEFPNAN